MDKEQALERIKQLRMRIASMSDEAAELLSIIEEPEEEEKKPLVQAKRKIGYSVEWFHDGYAAAGTNVWNSFETRRQAEAYAEAFNTLLDLRRQPGSEAAEDNKAQWFIRGDGMLFDMGNLKYKLSEISPPFNSKKSAIAALNAVGLDRILHMYNTLHGRGYE